MLRLFLCTFERKNLKPRMHSSRMLSAHSLPYRGSLYREGLCFRGFCLGGLCPGGLCPEGLCPEGHLSKGRGSLSVQWGLGQGDTPREEHGTRDKDPLERTWDQAGRQEVTSYKDPLPINRMSDIHLWKHYLAPNFVCRRS